MKNFKGGDIGCYLLSRVYWHLIAPK